MTDLCHVLTSVEPCGVGGRVASGAGRGRGGEKAGREADWVGEPWREERGGLDCTVLSELHNVHVLVRAGAVI